MIISPEVLSGFAMVARGEQVVCVTGDPRRPSICPTGFDGRLWKPVKGVQVSCYPGSSLRLCNAPGVKGNYAFLCRKKDPKTKHCPGVPGPGPQTAPLKRSGARR